MIEFDGLLVPQIGESEIDLAEIEEATLKEVERSRLVNGLDDSGNTVSNYEHKPSMHPARNLRLRLEAAHRHRIEGLSEKEVSDYMGYSEELTGGGPRVGVDAPWRYRYRSAKEIIQRGDEDWRRLGGWPWAAFDAKLPEDWLSQSARALTDWHTAAMRAARLAQRRAARWRQRGSDRVGSRY